MSAAPTKSHWGLKLLLALVVLVAAGSLAVYRLRPTARVVAVWRGHAVDARPGSVTVEAEAEQPQNMELGGRVTKSTLEPGSHYKLGEFMAQLDTGDIDLEIQQAKNTLDAAVRRHDAGSLTAIRLEDARAALANQERLFTLGQVAKADIEVQRNGVKSLELQLRQEEAAYQTEIQDDKLAIREKERQRDKMTLVAPFDGVVSAVLARPGALIPNGATVATLITTNRTVVGHISEEHFAGIAVGDKASVSFLGYSSSKLFDAVVSKILPTADPATQRYEVYLTVDIPVEKLMPGLTGEVNIVVDTHPSALLAPRRALFAGNKLFVVNDGRVELRTVEVGYISLNEVEIKSGLSEGDLVITDDLDSFSPGDRVRTEVAPN